MLFSAFPLPQEDHLPEAQQVEAASSLAWIAEITIRTQLNSLPATQPAPQPQIQQLKHSLNIQGHSSSQH